MNDQLQSALARAITAHTDKDFRISSARAQGGGCINEAWLVHDGETSYFVKLNAVEGLEMFQAEAAALEELAAARAIRVPQAITCGTAAGQSYLVLEALPFGSAKAGSWESMGRQLAKLHRTTGKRFGWDIDNTIGSTPQSNDLSNEWATFFREQRLRPQFELARKNGFRFEQADELLSSVDALIDGHRPEASLLHGDLWSGNAGFLDDGSPVIYDPATYYGDRETDLAFSELFGGFPSQFYTAYEKEWPLPCGYERRKKLYNLYHVLNHANLFGGGYAGQAQSVIKDLL